MCAAASAFIGRRLEMEKLSPVLVITQLFFHAIGAYGSNSPWPDNPDVCLDSCDYASRK